ncbi:Mob protein [Sulfitobacter sp. 1A12157]|uniref:Mob protein n=1 Tax=Sulfitobacter sp. 1A12157 TaxID=3368594 RepID=UPI003744E4AA
MAYQFAHIETYSAQSTPVQGSKDHYNNADQVLGEAARDPQYSTHVDMPLPARQFFGTLTLSDFRKEYVRLRAEMKETVKRKDGSTYERKLRQDAATLYTEIHSHPLQSAEFLADPDTHVETISAWMLHVKEHFKGRMPDGIDYTSVLHLDEAHVHIHILAMNTADPKLDANRLHVGKVAAAKFREAQGSDAVVPLQRPSMIPRPKKPKKPRPAKNAIKRAQNELAYAKAIAAWETECVRIKAKNAELIQDWKRRNALHVKQGRTARGKPQVHKVYAAAMRAFQDAYYEAVGKPSGLLRDGPRQARRSTKAHAADKKQAKRMADEIKQLKQKNKILVQTAEELKLRAQSLQRREADLTEAIDAMGQMMEAVETGESKVVNGKLYLSRRPAFFDHAPSSTSEKDAPAMMLVRRFIRLIVKHHAGLGGRDMGIERVGEGPVAE